MYGIAGIINKNGAPVDRGVLQQMTERARHRGPDGVGYHLAGNVGLGHRRLAIIDLSDGGHQPMHSYDGQLTITFNGEIYNYLEIREQLQRRGHRRDGSMCGVTGLINKTGASVAESLITAVTHPLTHTKVEYVC
jgi:asparagine synthase (glutamine-hydrolysing)